MTTIDFNRASNLMQDSMDCMAQARRAHGIGDETKAVEWEDAARGYAGIAALVMGAKTTVTIAHSNGLSGLGSPERLRRALREAAVTRCANNQEESAEPKVEVTLNITGRVDGSPAEVGRAVREAVETTKPESKPNPVKILDDAVLACLRAAKMASERSDGATVPGIAEAAQAVYAMAQAAEMLAEVRRKL